MEVRYTLRASTTQVIQLVRNGLNYQSGSVLVNEQLRDLLRILSSEIIYSVCSRYFAKHNLFQVVTKAISMRPSPLQIRAAQRLPTPTKTFAKQGYLQIPNKWKSISNLYEF